MKNAPFRERLFLALAELYTKEIKYTKNDTYNAVDFEKCTDKTGKKSNHGNMSENRNEPAYNYANNKENHELNDKRNNILLFYLKGSGP